MALFTESYLRNKGTSTTVYASETTRRENAARSLLTERRAVSSTDSFDIFLSHASEDAIIIKAIRDELVEGGYKVYVDWIDDPQLDRSHVNAATASLLRERMRQCKSLLFATSSAARKSVWMPWELGYMDAFTNMRVAIVPVVPDSEASKDFKGQEYLGIYPYFDKTGANFWVHRDTSRFVSFARWLREGANI